MNTASLMTGLLVALAAACSRGEAPPPGSATVTVDAARVLHEVSETDFHGINFVALWNDTQDAPATVRAFSQMGLRMVRFPGGCPAQWYDGIGLPRHAADGPGPPPAHAVRGRSG